MFKKLALVFILALLAFVAMACERDTSGKVEQDQGRGVDVQQELYYREQPIPFYDFSVPRDVLIQIYNATVIGNVSTYSVFYAFDKPVWLCPSYGFPIPVDTQLTNPLKKQDAGQGTGIVEQAEPNGLYSSKNTAGTWVLCVREGGELAPMYWEGQVLASAFPIKIVDGQVIDAGGSSNLTIMPGASRTDSP